MVVHPVYGFCRIAAIERAHVRDGPEDCYVFHMGSARNPIKVLVPVTQAAGGGLRWPITRQEADAILAVFGRTANSLEPRTKERLDEVSTRLSSTDLLRVAETIRDLVVAGTKGWNGQADGAFVNHRRSEQVLLSQAFSRLTEEVAYAHRLSRKEIEGQIRRRLDRTKRACAAPR